MTTILSPQSPDSKIATVQTVNSIPADLLIAPFFGDIHFGKNLEDEFNYDRVIKVKYSEGRIKNDDDQSDGWAQHVQVARDRHEQNIEITRNPEGHLFYRTLKNIQPSSTLTIWYSDQLAREIGIQPLTPRHIRSDQTYVCDRCQKYYQYPNCLKSHMRYRCQEPVRSSPTMSPSLYPTVSPPIIGQPVFPQLPGRSSVSPRSNSSSPQNMIQSTGPFANRRIQLGVNSAFVPPMPRMVPQSSIPPSRISPGIKPPSPTVKDDAGLKFAPKDVTPIQIFNHIHPPALLPMDYSALKYYYPFYQSFASASRFCCPSPQSCSTTGHCSTQHPYLFPPFNNPANAETNRLVDPNKTKSDESSVNQFKFPLPSEKAGEPLDLIPRSMYISKSRKGHLCIYCGKLYSRKYGLKIHLRTHTGYKPLKCKVCLRPFGDPSNLNKHIRLHAEGETPYRCDYCGKVLVRRRDLERHIKSRHPNEVQNKVVETVTDNHVFPANELKVEVEDEEVDEIIDVSND